MRIEPDEKINSTRANFFKLLKAFTGEGEDMSILIDTPAFSPDSNSTEVDGNTSRTTTLTNAEKPRVPKAEDYPEIREEVKRQDSTFQLLMETENMIHHFETEIEDKAFTPSQGTKAEHPRPTTPRLKLTTQPIINASTFSTPAPQNSTAITTEEKTEPPTGNVRLPPKLKV